MERRQDSSGYGPMGPWCHPGPGEPRFSGQGIPGFWPQPGYIGPPPFGPRDPGFGHWGPPPPFNPNWGPMPPPPNMFGVTPVAASPAGKTSITITPQKSTTKPLGKGIKPTGSQATTSLKRPHADNATDSSASAKQMKLEIPSGKNAASIFISFGKNAISILHEMYKGQSKLLKYLEKEIGTVSFPEFECSIEVEGQIYKGVGKQKKVAKMKAAESTVLALMQNWNKGKFPAQGKPQIVLKQLMNLHLKEQKQKGITTPQQKSITTPQQKSGPQQKASIPQQAGAAGPQFATPKQVMTKADRECGEPPCKVARLEADENLENATTNKSVENTRASENLQEKWPSWIKRYWCDICKCMLANSIPREIAVHMAGSKHKKQLAIYNLLQKLKQQEDCFVEDPVSGVLKCLVCIRVLADAKKLAGHLGGIRHKNKVKGIAAAGMTRRRLKHKDPHFSDSTCLGNVKSCRFWLQLIEDIYYGSSHKDRNHFIKKMIKQAKACIHQDVVNYHGQIIVKLENAPKVCRRKRWPVHVGHLKWIYKEKNKRFFCTCPPDIRNKSVESGIPPQFEQDSDPCRYVNPYLEDITCQGGEKSSLFWLGQIREVYSDLSRKKKYMFVDNMISQAHACIHKGYHSDIIKSLKSYSDHKLWFPQNIHKLKKKYEKLNKSIVCTCELSLTRDTMENHNSHKTSDSRETKEDDDPEADFTFDDILEVLDLD